MKLPKYVIISVFLTFGIIVLLPIIYMFGTAFVGNGQVCTNFFRVVFLNKRQVLLLKNSLLLASGVTFLSLIVGVWLALLLEKSNLLAGTFFRYVYIIPLLIPPYIHAIAWTQLLGKKSYNIHSLPGAIFVLTLAYFPFVTLITASGLKSIDQHLEEVSLLHQSPWKTIQSVTLPLVTPHIFSGAIFVFIFTLANFSVADILRVNVYPVEIFIQFSAFFNEKAATLLSLPLIMVSIALITLQNRHMKDRSYINLGWAKGEKRWLNLCPALNSLSFFFFLILIAGSVLLPIAVLLKVAGPFANYIKVFSTSRKQLSYSILIAGLGAFGSILLSFFIAHVLERGASWKREYIAWVIMIPLAVPAIVLGIGMIRVWNRSWTNIIYGNSLIVIFGYIARFIPFGVWSIQANFKQIPVHLEEAGVLITSRWSKIFKRITIPLCKPGLIAGFFIIFVLSLGELAATLLIIPPGRSTVPIKIYNLMHYGAEHMVAALSLQLVGIIAVFSLLFVGLFQIIKNKSMAV